MVYYLKYRPQKIGELDSLEVREKLYSVFSSSSIPHAFLFTGSKGLGKTSTARIMAKAINCERLVNQRLASSSEEKKLYAIRYTLDVKNEPCNACEQCLSITKGTNLDVLEIDGASNRGIDEIRDLREKIRLAPVSARKKVYIIDEVHMLTTEAFNALLKTLEEPPSHAMFILCTTEFHKVPETIISRSFHIAFKKASDAELISSLARIVKGEGLKIDEEAVLEIARLSDGGFRDGTKILEELVLLAKGEPITKTLVETKYQVSSIKYQVSEMIQFLVQRDTKSSLVLVAKIVEQGVDMKYFIEQMINLLHGQLLEKLGLEKDLRFKIQDLKLAAQEIKNLIELLARANGEMKYAVLPQLPLELVIIEWGNDRGSVGSFPPAFANAAAGRPASAASPSELQRGGVGSPKSSKIENIWQELLKNVKKHNHSIAGVLRGCSLKNSNDKELIIEAKYKFHKDKLLEPKTLSLLEKVGEEIIGKKIKVVVELKK